MRRARVGDELRVPDQLGEMALVGDRQEPVELAAAHECVGLQAADLCPVGIASGLYSSIFNASMVLVAWHEHDEKKAALAKAGRPSIARAPARVAAG